MQVKLQNSPFFCVFKQALAVKQKVWNEAENRERDWGGTLKIRLTRPTDSRASHHALPISLLILRQKTDCFAVYMQVFLQLCFITFFYTL